MDDQMDDQFGLLGDDEVLYVRSGRVLMGNPTFKASEFLDALAQLVSEREEEWSDEQEGWFTDRGLSCEVLRFGNQGWQQGRVRIRLEFCPERPNLSLDRPKLLQENVRPRDNAPPIDDMYRRDDSDSYPPSNRDDIYYRDNPLPPRRKDDFGDDPFPEFDDTY